MRRANHMLWAALLALPLAACGKDDDKQSLAALDAQLTNNAVDPALRSALADQIVVDPDLTSQSNRHAVRATDKPANAALPVLGGDARQAQDAALKLVGGKLLTAPAPAQGKPTGPAETLGAKAREQQMGKGSADCVKRMAYDMQWGTRLPEAFGIYPGAQLMEAAGAQGAGCTLRAASFVTPVPRQGVIDFYYTQARRAGYSAEHRIVDGDNILGGTRSHDDGAFLVTIADAPGGKTAVDIIANNGR
ncbi:hypothetical protein WG908_13960 [Sphingobium sp. AN641]|uniref:hypothetical protein n=1 Tax=Sphingobium sp. AN641 TaxID=3133443 RepID=UPI0030C03EB2